MIQKKIVRFLKNLNIDPIYFTVEKGKLTISVMDRAGVIYVKSISNTDLPDGKYGMLLKDLVYLSNRFEKYTEEYDGLAFIFKENKETIKINPVDVSEDEIAEDTNIEYENSVIIDITDKFYEFLKGLTSDDTFIFEVKNKKLYFKVVRDTIRHEVFLDNVNSDKDFIVRYSAEYLKKIPKEKYKAVIGPDKPITLTTKTTKDKKLKILLAPRVEAD